jgi:hypothetical protein
VGAGSITVTHVWNGATDGAPVSLTFYDSVRITVTGGTDQYWPIASIASFLAALSVANSTIGTAGSSELFGYGIGDAITATDGTQTFGERRVFAIEMFKPGDGPFNVRATHGDEYEPALPLPSAAVDDVSEQDAFENGLTWSKTDQPEHFMQSVRWLVGREDVPILRIFATRTALWILKGKGDGVYRLTGFGERSGWRVDQFDSSTYLLHPCLATQYGDAVYFWSNVGAVMLTDAGIVPLSKDPIGADTARVEIEIDHEQTNSTLGCFAAVNEKEGEVIFGLPVIETTETDTNRVFVLNTQTKAWSRWFASGSTGEAGWETDHHFSAAMYDPETRLVYFGDYGDGRTYVERAPDESYVTHADEEFTVTITDITGNTVTIAGGSGWTPAEGDLIRYSGGITPVTGVTSSTVFAVADGTQLSVAVGAVGYVAYSSVLQWITKTGGAPGTVKRFRTLTTHWEDTYGIREWSATYEPVTFGASASADYTRTWARTVGAEADDLRYVPRNAALGTRLLYTLEIRQADARWRLSGLTLAMDAAGSRLNR